MSTGKIAYWISTVLLCLLYLSGAVFYIMQRPMVEEAYKDLGYPTYLISLLLIAKIAGPAAILSRFSVRLSDLAYAGMFFHLLLAISAHVSAVDGGYLPAILGLVLLVVSFITQNAARKTASPNVPAQLGS